MKRIAALVLALVPILVQAQAPSTLPLVQAGDLIYQGSFKVPTVGATDNEGFAYGGSAIGFNPARHSLFLVGKTGINKVAEIDIPALGQTAKLLQPLTDVTEGRMPLVNPTETDNRIGGILSWGGNLVLSAFTYYDGAMTQGASHFLSSQTLATTGDLQGPFVVGSVRPGIVGGYMAVVPPAWHVAFGGPALTGQCCLAITGRTGQGPTVSAFDPADVGAKSPVPASVLLYPDTTHPLGGGWGVTGTLYNGSTSIGGVVFPEGTRSVLFFGRQGIGRFCYGPGTTNQALDGTLVGAGPDHYCYDLEDLSKGTHAYPYRYQVWAYDAMLLAEVKAGTRQPWDVQPYAVWPLSFPTASNGTLINGATYDPATGRVFLVQAKGDGDKPLIHVYTVGSGGPVVTPPPPQPAPPPPVVATAIVSVKTCTLTQSGTPPDAVPGWSVQFFRNGLPHGTVDATPPYVRAATVTRGSYLMSAVWTKAGQTPITVALGTVTCGP